MTAGDPEKTRTIRFAHAEAGQIVGFTRIELLNVSAFAGSVCPERDAKASNACGDPVDLSPEERPRSSKQKAPASVGGGNIHVLEHMFFSASVIEVDCFLCLYLGGQYAVHTIQ